MNIEFSPAGFHLPALDLWLDAREPATSGVAWISHAHGDHARTGHTSVYGSEHTISLFRRRYDDPVAQTTPMPWRQPLDLPNGARLTAFPAGHILGAAQLLIEHKNERLVYTGDIKLKTPLLGDATEIVRCDHLIIESTFGLPIFRFLSREDATARILHFALECLADKVTPCFLGYPLGRGQEIVYALTNAGIPTAVHGAIARLIPVYESAGYAFPAWTYYDARDIRDKALVVPPGFRATIQASPVDTRIAYVSGWALLDNARARSGAEELIPYSDHAGFDELLELVERSGARRVDVVHGYTEAFAGVLRAKGIDARAMGAASARLDVEDYATSGDAPATAPAESVT